MKTPHIGIENDIRAIEDEIYEAIKFILSKREGEIFPNRSEQLPPIDIYVCDDMIRVEVELPGIEKEDVEISYVNPFLSIKARKRDPLKNAKVKYHCMESVFGKLQRVVELPCAINIKNARASFTDGVLSIELPKVYERREFKKLITVE